MKFSNGVHPERANVVSIIAAARKNLKKDEVKREERVIDAIGDWVEEKEGGGGSDVDLGGDHPLRLIREW